MGQHNRRTFLKITTLSGGGFMLGFSSLAKGELNSTSIENNWLQLNGYVKITSDNMIKIMAPNPEGGQGVKTSMPMIVAEELDVDFSKIIIEQADLDTKHFTRQTIGGSQAIHQGWKPLRTAGAAARQMLRTASASVWNVPIEEVTTYQGMLHHKSTARSASYGTMANEAAKLPVPKDIQLKDVKDFTIVGKSKRNIDLEKIVTGKPLFSLDTIKEGMLIAMIVHPPAFGMTYKSHDAVTAQKMKGIKNIFPIKVYNDGYEKTFFDTVSFNEVVAIVGNSTWEVMQAKKALKVEWQVLETYTQKRDMLGRKVDQIIPGGLENTTTHDSKLKEQMTKPSTVRRKDGDVDAAFKSSAKVVERTYNGPFLAHNCMEPMNFFAHVTADKAELSGPLQKPEFTEQSLSARLRLPLDKIDIKITRLGGGYGRRSYAHWLIEAALISQKANAPIKLIYTREDDMTSGIYRPAYSVTYKAGFDAYNKLIAFHIKGGGVPESPLYSNRFPAGAVDNYLAEDFTIDSNITVGSFRAPRSNFIAAAEQSFLDEIAEVVGKDPIQFRLDLLQRAMDSPVGKNNEYDAKRYAEVIKLARDKSSWQSLKSQKNLGFSAYFCHDSYAANVLDLEIIDDVPVVKKVTCAIDCGIVVNPTAALNMAEGGVVDAIGTALYGEMMIKDGVPQKSNFHEYRMIRHNEAPKQIDVHFVGNNIDPTGMGEPTYPPVFAALANALYKAKGNRFYNQPYINELEG